MTMPESMNVGALLERWSKLPPETGILVCPEEPHVACHIVIGAEDWEEGDPYVTLATLDPGPTATAKRVAREDGGSGHG